MYCIVKILKVQIPIYDVLFITAFVNIPKLSLVRQNISYI